MATKQKQDGAGDDVLSIRVPSAMAKELRERARRDDRSVNSLVRLYLKRMLDDKHLTPA